MKAINDTELADSLEPLFLYVCRTNRLLRNGVQVRYEEVRQEIVAHLERARDDSKKEAARQRDYAKVELALIFAIDGIMTTSSAPWAARWASERLALRPIEMQRAEPEHGGDDRFFDMLDDCLKDSSGDTSQQLFVYYTCIGLGFMGKYEDQPMLLRQYLQQISQRLRRNDLSVNATGVLIPETYQHTNTSQLQANISNSMVYITTSFVTLTAMVFIVFVYFFREDSTSLKSLLQAITASGGHSIR